MAQESFVPRSKVALKPTNFWFKAQGCYLETSIFFLTLIGGIKPLKLRKNKANKGVIVVVVD